MPRLNLFGPQEKGLSVAINDQQSVNCYTVPSPRGRNEVALVGSMGTKLHANTAGDVRGCGTFGEVAYFVIGQSLYSVDNIGAFVALGTVLGSNTVSITYDGTSVIIVNGTMTGYYFNTVTTTFSTITLPAIAYTITYLDGYIAFSSDDQKWYISNVNDSDNFNALDFASAIKSPDPLVSIWEDHSELILFGSKTIEPWFNSANPDFAFSQNTAGIIERGLYARFSVAKDDNTLFFLGDDLIVYRMQGYQPVRISDTSTDTILSNLAKDGYEEDLKNATAFTYSEHGHKFYQLNIPNRISLVFNLATQMWHQAKHIDYETHMAKVYTRAYGKHLIGGVDGKVYEMSRSYYDDAGSILKRLKRTSSYSLQDKLTKWKRIKFIFDFGSTPVLTGQGSQPVVVVRWSYDYGRTFRSEKFLPLGESGDYLAKAILRACGSSRHRVFEFYVTDPVPFYCVDAFAEVM